jgi:hypothetical protein
VSILEQQQGVLGVFEEVAEGLLALAQQLLRLQALGDVFLDCQIVRHLAVIAEYRGNRGLFPEQFAILAPVVEKAVPDLAREQGLPQRLVGFKRDQAGFQNARVLADRFKPRITGYAREARIDVLDLGIAVGDDDGHGALFHSLQQVLGFFLRLTLLRDVGVDPDAAFLWLAGVDGPSGQHAPEEAAILASQHQFGPEISAFGDDAVSPGTDLFEDLVRRVKAFGRSADQFPREIAEDLLKTPVARNHSTVPQVYDAYQCVGEERFHFGQQLAVGFLHLLPLAEVGEHIGDDRIVTSHVVDDEQGMDRRDPPSVERGQVQFTCPPPQRENVWQHLFVQSRGVLPAVELREGVRAACRVEGYSEHLAKRRVGIEDGAFRVSHADSLSGIFCQAFEYLEPLAVGSLLLFAVDQVGQYLGLALLAVPQAA